MTDDLIVATLGPQGTDAAALALELSPRVHLVETFRAAVDLASTDFHVALIPCGAGPAPGEVDEERWVDLLFSCTGTLEIGAVLVCKTKPMCVARRRGVTSPQSIALHPATLSFARKYAAKVPLRFARSKVEAVEECSRGDADLCIGSIDVVGQHQCLEVLARFEPQMVWTLLSRPVLRDEAARLVAKYREKQ